MVTSSGSTTNNGESHQHSGHMMTLNIHIPRDSSVHSMQFDVQMLISDIIHNIQQYLPLVVDHDCKRFEKKK